MLRGSAELSWLCGALPASEQRALGQRDVGGATQSGQVFTTAFRMRVALNCWEAVRERLHKERQTGGS